MDVSKVREDFPVLHTPVGGKLPIYLDSACQTLRPRQVIDAVVEYYERFPSCGGRSVHKLATEVSLRCDDVRAKVARFLNAGDPSEIAFTKNTTEGLNTVIHGCGLRKGDEVVTTDYEHNSVHVPVLAAVKRLGVRHRMVPSGKDGVFDLPAFEAMMTEKVKLVALSLTSNVTGYTLPAKEVVRIAHSKGAKVLFDAAQTAPSRRVDLISMDVDYLAASAHKMLGPSGVGMLYVRSDLQDRLEPLMYGGHGVTDTTYTDYALLPAPERFETGLQDYAGVIGTGAAVDYLSALGMDEVGSHEAMLNRRLTDAMARVEGVSVVGPADPALRAGIFSFNVAGLSAHDVAMILDNSRNIMLRSGMHCCHPFFHARGMDGCVRASAYIYNTRADVDALAESVARLASEFGSRLR